MKHLTLALGASWLVLSGCGGGAKLGGGKAGAAQALFTAVQGATGAGSSTALTQGATATASGVYSCVHSGKVDYSASVDTTAGTNQTATVHFSEQFDNCSHDGKTTFNGNLALDLNASQTSTSTGTQYLITMDINGKLTLSGAISDTLEANVTETVDASVLSNKSDGSQVTVTLNGTIKTSTQTYTFNNESFTFTAGQLQAANK